MQGTERWMCKTQALGGGHEGLKRHTSSGVQGSPGRLSMNRMLRQYFLLPRALGLLRVLVPGGHSLICSQQ